MCHRLLCAALSLMLPLAATAAPPAARSVPATDAYPGFEVVDPYRNLEDLEDAETQAWMKAHADHARRVLDAIPERAAIRAALDKADATRPYVIYDIVRATDQRLFFMRREANASIAKLFVRDADSGEGRMVFDPASLDTPGQTHAISWNYPSPSGNRVVVGVAANGAEDAEFFVLDVETGEQLEGPIERSWLGLVSWLDEDHLLLGRMREPGAGEAPQLAWLDSQTWLHRIGSPISDDILVFGTQLNNAPQGLPPEDFVGVVLLPGESHALGFGLGARAHYAAWSLPAADLGNPDARWQPLFGNADLNQLSADVREGKLYVISTRSPNGEVVRYDMASGEREVLRPAGERPIEYLGVARDALYFRERNGVYSSLKRMDFDGSGEVEVGFPQRGSPEPAGNAFTTPALDGALVLQSAWTTPTFDYLVHADGSVAPLGLLPPVSGIDLSRMHARDLVATSHDGTRVPLTLLHYGDLAAPEDQRVMLTGYGAYGMTMDPGFSPQWVGLMQQGFALAVCHVRGGGEYGNAWHEAGRLGNKANTWKDFIACAESLHEQDITVPARLAGMGTSAGGILISNAVIERPELFAVAINDVGVSDVLRSLSASANGPNHYAENGDIRTVEGAAHARAASGYDKIVPGKPYPAWLVIHGVNDPRVDVWQSNKFTARMQAASDRPVVYRLDYASGHGMGSTADARKDYSADIAAFVIEHTRGGEGTGQP